MLYLTTYLISVFLCKITEQKVFMRKQMSPFAIKCRDCDKEQTISTTLCLRKAINTENQRLMNKI